MKFIKAKQMLQHSLQLAKFHSMNILLWFETVTTEKVETIGTLPKAMSLPY